VLPAAGPVARLREVEFGFLLFADDFLGLIVCKVKPLKWLGHSDARQVFDLPTANSFLSGSPTHHGHRPVKIRWTLNGKSETCRASAWQSHHEESSAYFASATS